MRILILGTPWNKTDKKTGTHIGRTGQSHSWETFVCAKRALGYELYANEYKILNSDLGSGLPVRVVLLRNDKGHEKRAEAQLTELRQTPRPTARYWRYDVYFENPQEMKYTYRLNEKLKYNGVRVT